MQAASIAEILLFILFFPQLSVEFQYVPYLALQIVADPVYGMKANAFRLAAAQYGQIGLGYIDQRAKLL
jgi:hypothetical protein